MWATLALNGLNMIETQKNIQRKSFAETQINYPTLILVCHNRKTNIKISKLQETALRLIYYDLITFGKLLRDYHR